MRRQLGWSDQRVSLNHYRDQRGREVDIVVEAADGRVMGIEVKSAVTLRSRDLSGLSLLRDRLGERFVIGVVLHTGSRAQLVGERILALPIDALWSVGT